MGVTLTKTKTQTQTQTQTGEAQKQKSELNKDIKNTDINSEKKQRTLFAVVRFIAYTVAYIGIIIAYTDFRGLCLSVFIFVLTMSPDYLIALLTGRKNRVQFGASIFVVLYDSIFGVASFCGMVNFLRYDSAAHVFRLVNNAQIILCQFNISWYVLGIALFASVCFYVFEYTGVLTKPSI